MTAGRVRRLLYITILKFIQVSNEAYFVFRAFISFKSDKVTFLFFAVFLYR